MVSQTSGLTHLSGSKYIHSDSVSSYPQVKEQLMAGKTVLFIGVSCQIAALQSYLKNTVSTEHLYTIELICHGGAPQKLFRHFIHYTEKLYHCTIVNYLFRDKSERKHWKKCNSENLFFYANFYGRFFCNDQKDFVMPESKNWFIRWFLRGSIYRRSCYSCRYASHNRPGDLILGDCWGGIREMESWDDLYSGNSLVIINTSKGRNFWEQNKKFFEFSSYPYTKVMKKNRNLVNPSPKPYSSILFPFLYLSKNQYYFFLVDKMMRLLDKLQRGRAFE
jgi:coenzyme F420-reducing hydrogenase beta subunit